MGKIVSAVAGGITDVINGVSSAVSDVASTAAQLGKLAENFAVPVAAVLGAAKPGNGYAVGRHQQKRSFLLGDGAQEDIGSLIKSTMKQAVAKAQSVFTNTYVGENGIRTDSGLVQNYCGTGVGAGPSPEAIELAISQVSSQIQQNFNNWQFPSTPDMCYEMSKTIVQEVFAKAGAGDTSVGTYSVTVNQSIDWVIAYGLFDVTVNPSTQALIYAFAAASNGGF
jgi:hypothetical protein